MSTLASDEVAADYRDGLEDLQTNDRSQINILTMIARESIEHAEAIARTLTNHIKKAPPARKLPALYVLDSIVKNVGSPYNVYFGRNLHETFMLAYSQVDQLVRKKLEEMLQTWRQPVPGSLTSTPVFPLSATQTIVDSLAKYKASTSGATRYPQQPQHQQPPRPSSIVQTAIDYRNTPTPPQFSVPYTHPTISIQQPTPTPQPYYQQPLSTQPLPQPPTPSYPPQNGYQLPSAPQGSVPMTHSLHPPSLPQPPQVRPPSRTNVDISKLHADIDDLTTDAKIICMTHPMDQQAQKKLASLQQIKEMLDSGTLTEDDLVDLRNSIMQQMAQKLAEQHRTQAPAAATAASIFPPQQQLSQSGFPQYLQPNALPQQSQQQDQPPPIPSFINSANLAELLRATANKSQTGTPTFQPPSQINTPPPPQAAAALVANELPLLAQLRASGFLSNNSTPPQGPTPPAQFANLSINDVPFTSPAIKIERPHLVLAFLNAKPNQCSTCGRRFTSDAAGQQKKEKHLDWHFKTKSRQTEAEQRGLNRSWYVDEREWIANKEFDDDAEAEANGAAHASPAATKKQEDIVRAPSDPVTRNAVCPIDQEPFKSEWSANIQDFIWRDAIRVGDRYYHASCYREMMKGREALNGAGTQPVRAGTPLAANHRRTATPDSVLGKRKADDEEQPPPSSASKMSRLAVPEVKAEQ